MDDGKYPYAKERKKVNMATLPQYVRIVGSTRLHSGFGFLKGEITNNPIVLSIQTGNLAVELRSTGVRVTLEIGDVEIKGVISSLNDTEMTVARN